jgi:FkbM family methyltransferase
MNSHIERVKTDFGTLQVYRNDNGVSEIIRQTGQYSFGEVGIYNRLLNEGDVFVDVGANIGAITYFLAAQNPNASFIGIEPQRVFYDLARSNNVHFNNVQMHQLLVGSEPATKQLWEIDVTKWGNFGGIPADLFADTKITVPQVTLDDFLESLNVVPSLVKIDAEGMEPKIIKGMDRILNGNTIISIEADPLHETKNYLNLLFDRAGTCIFITFNQINKSTFPDLQNFVSPHILYFPNEVPDIITRNGGKLVRSIADYLSRISEIGVLDL